MSHSETPRDGWPEFLARHDTGSILDGTVIEIVPFGAFLEVAVGVHGLLHKTEWSSDPEIGATLSVRILDIDRDQKRVSLAPAG